MPLFSGIERKASAAGPTRDWSDKQSPDRPSTDRRVRAIPHVTYRRRTLLRPSGQTTSTRLSILLIPATSRSALCRTCFK